MSKYDFPPYKLPKTRIVPLSELLSKLQDLPMDSPVMIRHDAPPGSIISMNDVEIQEDGSIVIS